MEIITQEIMDAKKEEVDELWGKANRAKIVAARAEEEYKNIRYRYYIIQGIGGADNDER